MTDILSLLWDKLYRVREDKIKFILKVCINSGKFILVYFSEGYWGIFR